MTFRKSLVHKVFFIFNLIEIKCHVRMARGVMFVSIHINKMTAFGFESDLNSVDKGITFGCEGLVFIWTIDLIGIQRDSI